MTLMNKDFGISMLLDFYKDLLTDKQIDALDLYYNQDLSLSEIAEHLHITRQGVRDNIKRGEKQLTEYEESLNLVERFSDIMALCGHITANIDKLENMSLSDDAIECISAIAYGISKIENLV